jgi:hypothetical protein
MSNDTPSVPQQKLTRPPMPFGSPQLAKVIIGSLDDVGLGVEAQYNPKELTIDHSIPWQAAKNIKGHEPSLEFAGGDGRSLSFELLFDGFESGQSVEQAVQDLTKLARVRKPESTVDELRRPHKVAVVWGAGSSDSSTDYVPPFRGVIESVQTKYTMFLPNGTPVRATCQVKIKEAAKVSFSDKKS